MRSPRIRVAVFLTAFHPGGTERQMIELISRLDRSLFDVSVACSHRQGAWLPRVEGCAPITEFPIRAFARASTLAQAAAFARWCRARRIAVVHTCEFYSNIFALPVAAMAGVPIRIGSRREVILDRTRSQFAAQRLAYRFASVVVTNARSAAGALSAEGIGRERIEIIPNGVAIDLYPSRARSGEIRTILTVANLRPEKAHEVLFEAAARLLRRYPSLRFQIVGDGPRGGELRGLASALGIRARVDF
ncbi:MAG TPA: glycosyltransferase, partial [Candidatus Cybelea sp.]|nr:glycosyltransferase [Candidatus Cybelea sp.]